MKGSNVLKTRSDRSVVIAALALSIMALFTIATQFAFSRFLHYDKQYRLLHPDHYNAELVTKADFDQIADPNIRTIALANGSQFIKADRPEWEKEMTPYYKAMENGKFYIKITTKGTAHFLRDCFTTAFGAIIMNMFIVVICIRHLSKSGKGQQIAPGNREQASGS